MDEKRTQVLCSGLLVKSPTKSELKAGFATFWKVRWCVLVRVTYPASSNKDLKLLFCYYKNKDHFNHQSKPIGTLKIDQDTEIHSCYESQSGFDHLFSIRCPGKKFVKLSAPSCKLKSQWITIMYYYSSLHKPKDASLSRLRSNGRRTNSDSAVKSRTRSQGSIHSDSYPLKRNDSSSSQDKFNDVFPEDTAPVPRLSRSRSVLRFLETRMASLKRLAKNDELGNEFEADEDNQNKQMDMSVQRIYSDVFMLCETCQGKRKKTKEKAKITRKSSYHKKESLKEYENQQIETEQSIIVRKMSSHDYPFLSNSPSYRDDLSLSKDSAFHEDEYDSDFADRSYSIIDEKWLSKVQEIMEKTKGDGKLRAGEDAIESNSVEGSSVGDYSDDDENDMEEYMDMHVIQEEVKSLMLGELGNAKPPDDNAEGKGSRFAVKACLSGLSEYGEVLFEMNL